MAIKCIKRCINIICIKNVWKIAKQTSMLWKWTWQPTAYVRVQATEKKIKNYDLVHQKIVYEDIFKNTLKQKNNASLFGQLSEIKKSKIEK